MSIELPEATILAKQMNKELVGKQIESWKLDELEKLQKSKMVSRSLKNFDKLKGRTVQSVVSRGNGIRIQLDDEMNMFLAPEYGGAFGFHKDDTSLPMKIHLTIAFSDKTLFTLRLKGWGNIDAASDAELDDNYVYRRDFSDVVSPDEKRFTTKWFTEQISQISKNIKMALVGKEAILVGIQNSTFQDIIYQAGIHPKKKASELSSQQIEALYNAIVGTVQNRKRLGGKDQFTDLYGKQGQYTPSMGPNMKNQTCPKCKSPIEKLAHGGGHVYLCPNCQT
ncbi:MAG: DNA-formamidopyrimidine glycosylase family protein [Candidatus Thorarchaeota archaeon]